MADRDIYLDAYNKIHTVDDEPPQVGDTLYIYTADGKREKYGEVFFISSGSPYVRFPAESVGPIRYDWSAD